MNPRNRAIRDRVAKARADEISRKEFGESLDDLKRVVDGALADGLKTLTPAQFAQRLHAEHERRTSVKECHCDAPYRPEYECHFGHLRPDVICRRTGTRAYPPDTRGDSP